MKKIRIGNYRIEERYDASYDEAYYDVFLLKPHNSEEIIWLYIGELDYFDVERYIVDGEVIDENAIIDLIECI